MSTETAILVQLQEVNTRLGRLEAGLDSASPTPWPDRMRTSEAVIYVRQAYHLPRFSARTLYKWLAAGRLSDVSGPRRWVRGELDQCCSGTPVSSEGRGARRRNHQDVAEDGS